MSTITSSHIIVEMLQCGGSYQGDPVAAAVYKYTNTVNGTELYAVYYDRAMLPAYVEELFQSPYVANPTMLFGCDIGLTDAGKAWLAAHEQGYRDGH